MLWSPKEALPKWWDEVPSDREVVFVNLGSSGDPAMLPRALEAIRETHAVAVVTTAGRATVTENIPWVFTASFLPGDAVLRRASTLICNGGSPAAYQALSVGKPVIGIASNMDQLLFMRELEAAGMGIGLRTDSASKRDIRNSLIRTHDDRQLIERTRAVTNEFNRYHAPTCFQNIINEVLQKREPYGRVHNL